MHEYLKRLQLAIVKGLVFEPTLHMMNVEHDDRCSINQNGLCDCDPRITINGPQGNIEIDGNGNSKPVREH